MAGALGNTNAVGNSGGKSLQDRKLAADVRKLTLNKIKVIFEMARVDMNASDAALHDALLIKLAGSVLPRLTEVTGEDGGALLITLSNEDKTKLDNLIDGKPLKQSSNGEDSLGNEGGKDLSL